ncbi:GGDEF domain-containing protein [Pseudoalteromonas denitrificans]|uniref:Diguanylate cyclase DosC n=1 Tax=Pseudoalteromonas denitrificans DSM 6059 TaxID=1123010 RepID=A0A1I1L0I5_9GAMM|nr:GGDEF domain-containing protein [Pseudoalteromonas denitrificans]SFC66435.1 diguanylate cyclase (GGDEF) domain-containing protein [Pseudoalteromonas denitrificans DSM 6059]
MNYTDKTLLERMKITKIEILERLNILGLHDEEIRLLSKSRPFIETKIEHIINTFYQKQISNDEVAALIGDSDTLVRLKEAQHAYILDLFSGKYDADYVNNRLRIGMVHKRIGVDPKLYLTALSDLKYIIIPILIENITNTETTIRALDKLLTFDATLVFDTYIDSIVSEVVSSKEKLEIYAHNLERKSKEFERLSKLDSMTGLYNRRAMQDMLNRELIVSKRRKSNLSLAYFDIDDFKNINDLEGHNKGDKVIIFISSLLLNQTREVDIPCRAGGDEFCLILPECNTINAKNICTKILAKFIENYPNYNLSIGIADTGNNYALKEYDLIKSADSKMYKAKKENAQKIQI